MGISGLLPAIREAAQNTSLSEFAGKRAAVDGSVWLHRGCIACARSLAKGEKNNKYITYFLQQVQLLIDKGIRPYIVFDGADLPAKRDTNERRRSARLENIKLAETYEMCGLTSEAEECYQKAVEISPDMLPPLFKALKKRNVEYIVAPYEADAQLAYLCIHHVVDFVITEDSDLLVYQCPLTVFKVDRDGNCQSIALKDVMALPDLAGMSIDSFIECCILSGCDYLPNIPRMGFRTAVKRMQRYRTLTALLAGLRSDSTWDVPSGYEEDFVKVRAIFAQQRVYDPRTRTLVGVHQECESDLAGPYIPAETVIGVATGVLNSRTHEPFDDEALGEEEEQPKRCRSAASYNIKVTEAANQPFKPHFPNSLPPRSGLGCSPIRRQGSAPCTSPKKFVPPSLRGGMLFCKD